MKRVYGVLIVVAIALSYGLATGFPLSYRLVYVLVGVLGGSIAWAYVSLQWLRVTVERPVERAQVGDVVGGRIILGNMGILPKVWLEVQDAVDLPGQTTGTVVTLSPRRAWVWGPRTPLLKRGEFNLGPVQVHSADLFGVFQIRRSFGDARPILVYPRVVPLPAFQVMAAEQVQQDMRQQRTFTVTPLAASIREYTHGDSLKRIHWPSTARTGRLMSKEFDSGMGGRAWIVLDLERAVQAGGEIENTEEYAITAAASIAARYLEMGWPVGRLAHGDRAYFLPAERSVATLDRLLYILAVARAQGEVPLGEVLRDMRSHWTPSSLAVVITPSGEGEWVSSLEQGLRRGTQVGVVLIDSLSFGGSVDSTPLAHMLRPKGVPTYVVRRGDLLEEALSGQFGMSRSYS